MQIPPARVSEIQTALAKRGYYSGTPNGRYDEPTKDAMRRFQTANNLTVSGLPSAKTLKLLGLSATQSQVGTLTPASDAENPPVSPEAAGKKKESKLPEPDPKPQPKGDHPY